MKDEMNKRINDRIEKMSYSITKEEFMNIQFDSEWPMIVHDVAKYLTGLDLLKGTRISEADELPN